MSAYLIDSHILVWARVNRQRLSKAALAILEDAQQDIYYSIVSSWELAIKESTGRLPLAPRFFEGLTETGFVCLPVEEKHIETFRALPRLHKDPFDRMLVAQANAEGMTLITADKRLAVYPVKLLQV